MPIHAHTIPRPPLKMTKPYQRQGFMATTLPPRLDFCHRFLP
ncbi:hypothetical protein [Moraxella lacunata]